MLQGHPKLLYKECPFTRLCIVGDHRRILHEGYKAMFDLPSFKTPVFAPLPHYVIYNEFPPFTFTGIDYMGPLFVADGNSSLKNWICLFTCLNIRAIHLELIDDMSTESFFYVF